MDAPAEFDLPETQRLALAHCPSRYRAKTADLLALDERLADTVRRAGEPALAQMRLAWWREMLAKPATDWPGGEPLLSRLTCWSAPQALAGLVDGWEHLLADQFDGRAMTAFAEGRAAGFTALASELGVAASVASAARTWALADLAAHLAEPGERALAIAHGLAEDPQVVPRPLRSLAVLSALGHRALRRGGRPLLEGRGAALVALRVGLFGR